MSKLVLMMGLAGKPFPDNYNEAHFQREYLDKYNLSANWKVVKYIDSEMRKYRDNKE